MKINNNNNNNKPIEGNCILNLRSETHANAILVH